MVHGQKKGHREVPLTNRNHWSGANRFRTDDLLNAIQALSQLSYGPNVCPSREVRRC